LYANGYNNRVTQVLKIILARYPKKRQKHLIFES
jgi:hypothetical protein